MQKRFLPLVFLVLTGCSDLEFPWVYRINVDQGNIITQDMVNQLSPGMTRSQVQFVMGSALLVDTFHDDRWDYVYTFQDSKGKRSQHRMAVFFKDDKLAAITGDFAPEMQEGPLPPPKAGKANATDVNPADNTGDAPTEQPAQPLP